jgi:transposase-like protein
MIDLPRNFYTLSMFVPKNKMEEITFFLQFGFIGTSILCQICNCFMFLYPGQYYRDQFCWKCTKCKTTYSILRDSIFSNFQEQLFKILIGFYCFAKDMSLDSTVIQIELSKTTIQKIFRLLRNCCCRMVAHENYARIGWNELNVQIDENHISKRKYQVGRPLCHYWIIGGIEEGSNRIFLTISKHRSAPIMKRIIRTYVNPNSIIKTDQWKGYSWIDKSRIYTHLTVNHSKNFVNPTYVTHKQNIERL